MIQESQEEYEYDVLYRGSKEQLFAFLYPLTGPNSTIFEHLEMKHMYYDPNKKNFEVRYEPKDFQNIDKQKQQIVYTSNLLPTQSNYFYSVFQQQSQYKYFVWQSIDNFVEMRPKNRGLLNTKQKQLITQQTKIELQIIDYQSTNNKARQLIEDTVIQPVKQNWQVSKQQYLLHLAK